MDDKAKHLDYILTELDKWQAGRDDENWSRLGRIFQERFKSAKTVINRMVKLEDSISITDKIKISKCRTFGEVRNILNQ